MVGSAHWVADQSSAADNTDYQLWSYERNNNHHSVNYATGSKSTITVTYNTSSNKISFSSTTIENPVTATATRSYKNSGGSRFLSGDGSVQINSGSTSTTTATATVESGSSVTFTAIPDNGNDFAGWYSDEACTTLVDTNTTHTVSSMTSDTTLYAAFNKHYYLVGKFYLADQAKEVVAASTETGYQFTQSSTNPAEYTYQNDFMFKYNTGEGSYHLQYVTVGSANATKAYVASTAGAASGTAASGWDTLDNSVNGSDKWTCGDSINATYPSSNLNNCYKHVTFTWNAINETLSWTTTDIDETHYTKIYVHGGTYKYEHMWLGNNVGSLTSNGQLLGLIGTPYIEVNGTAYNVVLVKNATVGANGLYTQLYENNDTSSTHTNDLGPMTAGSSYTLDGTAATVALVAGAPTAATVYYLTGWLNGVSTTTTDDSRKFTESATAGIYTLTWTPTADHSGYQYVTIFDGTNAWHPASSESGTGTAAGTTPDTSPGNDNKWMVEAAANQTVTFTWDTTGAVPVLSWTVSSSGGGSGLTPTSYKLMYGTGNNWTSWTARSETVYKTADNKYYVNLSDFTGDMGYGNHYFALSTDSSYKNIIGIMDNQNTGKSIAVTEDDTGNYLGTTYESSSYNYDVMNHGLTFPRVWRTNDSLKGLTLTIDEDVTTSGKVTYAFVTSDQAIVDGGGGGDTAQTVLVYAKDGAAPIDWDNKTHGGATDTAGYNSKYLYNFARVGSTTCTSNDSSASFSTIDCDINNGTSNSKYQTAQVAGGKTVTITTTIDDQTDGSTNWRSKYYVKGWSINGVTYNSSGVVGVNSSPNASTTSYSMTYTLPTDLSTLPVDAANNPYIEITPIYYLQSNSGCVTFYLEGYNTVQSTWGHTPYAYPFYGNLDGYQNSFGVYPGQPMVNVNGQYSIEIPINTTAIKTQPVATVVKGITLSNGYADHVHRNLIYGWTDEDNDADHKQTYDFDDFYKIYAERLKNGQHPNAIFFRMQRETKVYNRSSYGGGKSGQFADGTSTINISTINSSGNGWHLLQNRFGENVNIFGDTNAVSDKTATTATGDTSQAIYVVSTGYNANIAGDYGTMWKVYNGSGTLITKDTTNKRYGIPPSLLHLAGNVTDGITSTVTYTSASRSVDGVGSYTDENSKYNGVYKQLKAADVANKLVYVTFEQDTQDTRKVTSGTGAYRLDGQWFYTHAADYVQSTIGIEYYNNSTGAWTADTVSDAGVGSTTGATANFSNNKTTSSREAISSGSTWSFSATNGTNYVFDGWYIKYSDTSYDLMTRDASGSIKATANYTLIARYVPQTTGNLTITHSIASASTGEGNATMTVSYNGTAQTVNVVDGVARTNISGISNSDLSKTISVTLTSTPLYDGKVSAFGYDSQLSVTPTESSLNTAGTAATSTFNFTVQDLFNSSHTSQVIVQLDYTSTITATPHYYNFTYNFTPRGASTTKSYYARGEISLKEFKEYFAENDTAQEQAFVRSKAPFESNFLKTTALAAGNVTVSSYTYSCTSTFGNTDTKPTYTIRFKLPYEYETSAAAASGSTPAHKKYNATSAKTYNASKATFDVLAKYDEFVTVGATASAAGAQTNVSKVTDATDVNHAGNNFFTAPDELTLSGTTYYFQCWEIRRLADSNQSTAPIVSKIYYPDLNYRIYGDYYIEAKFSTNAENYWHNTYINSADTIDCSVLYLGDSRNQYNSDSESTITSSDTAADKIYNDFMFAFNDKGAELKGSSAVKIGYIIERVVDNSGSTKQWAVGSSTVSDMSYYKSRDYGTGYDEATVKADILAKLGSANSVSAATMRSGCIGFDLSTANLNNRNYIEDSYYVFSQCGQKFENNSIVFNTDNPIDKYVYRVYAVIKGTDNAWHISDPAYFCMRYTANLNYTE